MAFMTDTPEEKPIAVPAYSSSGIFGEDVNDVRQQIAMQQQNNAMQFANMPRGRGPVYAAALAGQQLGGAVANAAGWVDPRIDKAQKLQDAAKEVDSQGLSLMTDPDSYYKAAYASLTKRGLFQEAAKVADIMQQQDIAKYQAQTKRIEAYKGTFNGEKGVGVINTANGEIVPGTEGAGMSGNIVNMGPAGLTPDSPSLKPVNLNDPNQVKAAVANGWVKYAAPGTAANYNNTMTMDANKERMGPMEKSLYNRYDTAQQKAGEARDILSQVTAYNSILDSGKFEPGTAANFRGMLGKVATYLGYPDLANTINSKPGDYEALNSISTTLLGNLAQKFSGKASAKALQTFQNAIPTIGNTYAGNYVINKMLELSSQHDIDRAEAYNKFAGETTTGPNGKPMPLPAAEVQSRMDEWDKAHPLVISDDVLQKAQRHGELMEYARQAKNLNDFITQKPDGSYDVRAIPGKYYKVNGMLVKVTRLVPTKVTLGNGTVKEINLPDYEVAK